MLHFLSLKFVLFMVVLALFDAGFNAVLEWQGAMPIFLYLLVCYTAFEWSSKKTLWVAFIVGLFRDSLGGGFLGVETISLVICTATLDFIVHKIEREFPGIYFLLTLAFVVSVLTLQYLFSVLFGIVEFSSLGYGMSLIFKVAIYTGLFLSLFYHIADWWFRDQPELKQYELFN